MHITSLTDYSKVAKITERHKIASLTAEGCFPAVINSRKAEGKVCPWVETLWRSPCLAVKWLVHLCCHTALLKVVTVSFLCFTTNCVLVLAYLFLVLCEVFVRMFVQVHIQDKNSNGTTVKTFSSFNCLRSSCMLLPFLSTLMSLCCRYMTTRQMWKQEAILKST